MALVVADRVKESTTTTGTGTLSLGGAVSSFQTFVSGIGGGNTTYYAILDSTTGDYEVGIGTVTDGSPDTLSRDTVLDSSNSGNKVNLSAGTKYVFCTQPAEKAVFLDANDDLTLPDESSYKTTTQNLPDIRPSLNLDFANSKTLDPRIDFTRASTATYYDGKTVAKAEENLVKYSQEFNTGWVVSAASLTTNSEVAPDGTTTAEFVVATATTEVHRIYQAVSANTSLPYTISVFCKAGGIDQLFIRTSATNSDTNGVLFDLTLETTTNVGPSGATSSSITAVGNNWYRLVCTFTPALTALNVYFGLAVAGSKSFLGNETDGIYIWGAQLEQRDSVTAYTPTTDQPITNYIPVLQTASSGEARFDHDPVTGESKGLLIEEQRTNLFTNSGSALGGARYQATRTDNATISPDGTLSATRLTQTGGVGSELRFITIPENATISFFVKSETATVIGITAYTWQTNNNVSQINLATQTVLQNGYNQINTSITSIGNGWFRVSTQNVNAEGNGIRLWVLSNEGDSIFYWGFQLEAGAFPTSYIKTEASQVTRSADSASITAGTVGTLLVRASDDTWTDSTTEDPTDTITFASSKKVAQYPKVLTQAQIDAVTEE